MPQPQSRATSNKRTLLVVGVVVLLAAIAFLTFSDWLAYRRLGKENGELTRQIAEAKRRRDVDLPEARERLIDLEEEQDRFKYVKRLPDTDQLETFIDRVSEFEEISRVRWHKSVTKEPRGSVKRGGLESYDRIQYNFDLTGQFFQFCQFINLLENMERLVTVDEFTIKRTRTKGGEGTEEEPTCDIKLTFSVYVLKAAAPPEKTARPRDRGVRTARS